MRYENLPYSLSSVNFNSQMPKVPKFYEFRACLMKLDSRSWQTARFYVKYLIAYKINSFISPMQGHWT
jgi:hypothetical protein